MCSYLAEVPEAHADRVRALLPALLTAGAASSIDTTTAASASLPAVPFLVPALSQVRWCLARH